MVRLFYASHHQSSMVRSFSIQFLPAIAIGGTEQREMDFTGCLPMTGQMRVHITRESLSFVISVPWRFEVLDLNAKSHEALI